MQRFSSCLADDVLFESYKTSRLVVFREVIVRYFENVSERKCTVWRNVVSVDMRAGAAYVLGVRKMFLYNGFLVTQLKCHLICLTALSSKFSFFVGVSGIITF